MEAITIDEILINLEKALKSANFKEITKWEMLYRSELDFRVRLREKQRKMQKELLQYKFRKSYTHNPPTD